MMSNIAKSFDILANLYNLSSLYNYFDSPTKLFLELYLSKFFNTSAKSFFPCIHFYERYFRLNYMYVII